MVETLIQKSAVLQKKKNWIYKNITFLSYKLNKLQKFYKFDVAAAGE
jgi:hypothetical protein